MARVYQPAPSRPSIPAVLFIVACQGLALAWFMTAAWAFLSVMGD